MVDDLKLDPEEIGNLNGLWKSDPDVSRCFMGMPDTSHQTRNENGQTLEEEILADGDTWTGDIELSDAENDEDADPDPIEDRDDSEDQESIRIPAHFILTKRDPIVIALAAMSSRRAAKKTEASTDTKDN